MPDNKNLIKTVIEFVVDKASLNKTSKGFDKVKNEQKELDKLARKQKNRVKDVAQAYEEAHRANVTFIQDQKSGYKALIDLEVDLQNRLSRRDDQFGDLSRNVGLAGDFQSNLNLGNSSARTAISPMFAIPSAAPV